MVNVATVTSKGQITLPVSIRKRLGLRKGSKIVFLEAGEEVRIFKEEDLERQFAVFDRMREDSRLTRRELRALVKEAKDRLWKEHFAGRR